MNLNKSPGTTSKMVDRASQSLFIDVETCDAEREEKYDSDSNSEKCLTPVQKFDVSPVLDDDETSLEWDHMKGHWVVVGTAVAKTAAEAVGKLVPAATRGKGVPQQ